MQSIEQNYYRETEEQYSNGCKLLVKKDAMLDSLDFRERSYDNSANGINFKIRKVNRMFVFIVVVWIYFFLIISNSWGTNSLNMNVVTTPTSTPHSNRV